MGDDALLAPLKGRRAFAGGPGAIVRIDLATRTVTDILGTISDRNVKRAERLVARHAKRLRAEWTNIHGRD